MKRVRLNETLKAPASFGRPEKAVANVCRVTAEHCLEETDEMMEVFRYDPTGGDFASGTTGRVATIDGIPEFLPDGQRG